MCVHKIFLVFIIRYLLTLLTPGFLENTVPGEGLIIHADKIDKIDDIINLIY